MLLPRILVMYATTHGQTRKIAFALSETLRAANLDVDVVNAGGQFDPLPEDYSGVIVAAPVRAGHYPKAVRGWVRRHAEALGNRPTAFVSVCLSVSIGRRKRTPRSNECCSSSSTRRVGARP